MEGEEKPTRATKAQVGGGLSGIIAFLTSIEAALGDGVITGQEWISATVAALVSLGAVFGGVYATTNKPKP